MNYLKELEEKYSFHGGPWDRGSADSYYRRPAVPHWYPEGTGFGRMVPESEMTEEEVEAYYAGFEENERQRNFKDY